MNRFNQTYWESRYQEHQTGWDVGSVSTPMKEFIDSLTDKNLKILIPGAGNGHEFDYLMSKGFLNVTLVDIAAQPLINLKNRHAAELHEQFVQQDFFDIQKKYELILEQTFFCALDPHLRMAYAKKMYEILEPNGILAGVLFNFELSEIGPPFGGSLEEYRSLFEPYFEIQKLEPCFNSIKPRAGKELFIKLKKKNA